MDAGTTAAVDQPSIISTVKEIMKTPEMKIIINDAVVATANNTSAGLNASPENSDDVSIAAAAPHADAAPAPAPATEATSSATDNNTNISVKEKMYDIDGAPGNDTEKHIYTDLGAVNAARLDKGIDSLIELQSGGRRRTKHKKHHKKGGKKSHKKGKSSKKVAKRRKSCKTGGRRSRKQNKH